ncbi:TetR/AcrR family transcriptional regulator [Acinetobacter baumannii]
MHDPVLESHHLVCEKPQTRRGIERRLALLLSATELFLEKGYDAVSLDDIVNHAGGSKTSIYKYFGNKDGLFTAICDYRREMFFKDICIAFQPEQTSAQALLISHQSGEITCTSPDHSSLMYFGILRDIEWRMIMGMPLPPNETEVIDYINYCVDIFLKGHHKV